MKKIMVCVVLFHIVSCFLVNNGHIVIGVKTVFANKTIDNMTSMDHISCGFDFENKGQYEDAIKEFSLAITKDSSYYLAFMCRGDIYKLQGKYGARRDFLVEFRDMYVCCLTCRWRSIIISYYSFTPWDHGRKIDQK